MIHKFKVSGMTCNSCVSRVEKALSEVKGVENVTVTLNPQEAEIKMTQHIDKSIFNKALEIIGDYKIGDEVSSDHHSNVSTIPEKESKLKTYKPLIIIFFYILIGVTIIEFKSGRFNLMEAMNNFMAGFFIVFSFFKMLDLPNFASSYSSYDIIAGKWYGYGFIYPFIELTIGIFYFLHFYPVFTNVATIIIMGVSSIGVIKSVMQKRTIQCACLGTVFNLPMSTITILEDLLMVFMAIVMLLTILI